ncbi:TRAP transporter small permease subunit [Lacimicrobium alkaliphilum]|uniref:TRAP transporter small permease protein n=1 Tax=Lacimicrobium alkaliphilum TaxID=1526571 RepID=A0ABQ1QVU0_9ALTE|nr:TRAP transporter small permease subunit [Lacimicrobium alkaliphilum]GGD48714.1 C4-dicarboxylate ABC transporter [Lacimicrobium alkaliphilum]
MLQRCQIIIDRTNDMLCKLVSWLTLLMVLLVFTIVLLRYGFNLGWIAMQESALYLHAIVFLLGAAHTLKADEHVRVDIFYRNASPGRQAWIDILGTLLLLIPVSLTILILSWDYAVNSWALLEASGEAGGLPLVFILKSLIPLFALTMLLQGIAQIFNNILFLKDGVR